MAKTGVVFCHKTRNRHVQGRLLVNGKFFQSAIKYSAQGVLSNYGCADLQEDGNTSLCPQLSANRGVPCTHCIALYLYKCHDL